MLVVVFPEMGFPEVGVDHSDLALLPFGSFNDIHQVGREGHPVAHGLSHLHLVGDKQVDV